MPSVSAIRPTRPVFPVAVTLLSLALTGLFLAGGARAADTESPVDWQSWSPAVFEQAAKEDKLVLLDLGAVWCHWCHVMDRETYANPDVAAYLAQHYVAVKVDQDRRPDLANRFRDYGWPATIVFNAGGTEIVKRAGYIPPDKFMRLLTAIVADPSPEAATRTDTVDEFVGSPLLTEAVRDELLDMHERSYDWDNGGLDLAQKFLDRDSVEYALREAWQGDEREARKARQTLDASYNLIDPVWGGIYQYSTGGDWHYPHFEKIMTSQAGYLRIYALAYAQWQDPDDLRAARSTIDYLNTFLSGPDGAFYTSQDADVVPGQHSAGYFEKDDEARRQEGIPRVDTHRYARENGWAIEALTRFHDATGDTAALDRARQAARWVLAERRLPGGGFRHDAEDPAGPYLGDSLAMGRACLSLYRSTAERPWLDCATGAAGFIDRHFRQDGAGFITSVAEPGVPVAPAARIEENISVTRFANLLHHYTGDTAWRALAEHGMRYLATPAIATARVEEAGILLADQELARAPRHFTIVGAKDDPQARALYRLALAEPGDYKRIEWWDREEGPLPNPDVQYPATDRAAAYVCTDKRCSLPAFNGDRYAAVIARLTHPSESSDRPPED